MAPFLRDLTRSSVSRVIDLCLSFDHINFKRCLPVYYEDCLALPKRFPEMYESFLNRDFVVRHSSRKGSAVPVYQAMKKLMRNQQNHPLVSLALPKEWGPFASATI